MGIMWRMRKQLIPGPLFEEERPGIEAKLIPTVNVNDTDLDSLATPIITILRIGTGQLPICELFSLLKSVMTNHSAEAMSCDIFRPRNSL